MSPLSSLLILLISSLMGTQVTSQGGISDCCRKVSGTRVHRDTVVSYYKQRTHACPIEAVVFTHVSHRRICSSPHSLWARTTMAYVDGKQHQQRQRVKGRGTAATPPGAPAGPPTRRP